MRRWEWHQQVLLSRLLDEWLDPGCSFATAIDNVASSALSGFVRKKRGVVAGLPDNLVVHWRKRTGCVVVFLELKSPGGKCSPSQRAVREALLRSGAQWWVCRTADAAMWALSKSGVKFRVIVNKDGTVERWQQPRLEPWEVPRRDPSEPRPQHPEVAERQRAAQRQWRARVRERAAAKLVAERDDAGGADIAA
jgi:hypothetical protein